MAALEALPDEIDRDPDSAARVAAEAGAAAVLVPTALASLARLRRRASGRGGAGSPDASLTYVAAYGVGGYAAFDLVDDAGELVEGAAGSGLEGVDAGDSALESVARSIDSAVNSRVDAGGGGGGDFGGGGGDGGGGGGDGGGGGGGGF